MLPRRCCAATVQLLLLVPSLAAGQSIEGRLLDGTTGEAVASATIVLVDDAGRDVATTLSDAVGHFAFTLSTPGPHTLRVEALGFATLQTVPLSPAEGEVIRVDVRLGWEALPIDPLVVTARSRAPRYPEFERHLERGRRTGSGAFLVREDLEKARGQPLSILLLRIPGAPLRRDARGQVYVGRSARTLSMTECEPALFVDGVRMSANFQPIDDLANPIELMGVEVYRSQTEVPADLGKACGALVLWTRQGQQPPDGGSWIPTIIMSSIVGVLLLFAIIR